MQICHGDIIYTTCTNIPLCYHVGIVLFKNGCPYVWNNTPSASNSFGGNVVAQPFAEFMKGRKLLKTEAANITEQDVVSISDRYKAERWNAFRFNCEDYVNEIKTGNRHSRLRALNLCLAATAFGLWA